MLFFLNVILTLTKLHRIKKIIQMISYKNDILEKATISRLISYVINIENLLSDIEINFKSEKDAEGYIDKLIEQRESLLTEIQVVLLIISFLAYIYFNLTFIQLMSFAFIILYGTRRLIEKDTKTITSKEFIKSITEK